MRDPSLTNSYGYYQYYTPVVPDYDANILKVPELLSREYDLIRSRNPEVYVKNPPNLGNVQGTGAVGTGTSFLIGNQPPPMVDPVIANPLTNVDLTEAAKVAEVVGVPLLPPSLTVRQFGEASVIPSTGGNFAAIDWNNLTVPDDRGINPVINAQGDRLADVTKPNPLYSLPPAGPQLPNTGLSDTDLSLKSAEQPKDSGISGLAILGILISILK